MSKVREVGEEEGLAGLLCLLPLPGGGLGSTLAEKTWTVQGSGAVSVHQGFGVLGDPSVRSSCWELEKDYSLWWWVPFVEGCT